MKQKITSYVMALIMTASLFMPISVNAETDGTITVSDVKATAGSTIAVPVKISNNPGILGATLTITFDEGLTLLDGINGNALASHQMTPPGTFTSPCNFVWDKAELANEDIADGVLLTLKFKTPADAQPGTKYNVSVSNSGIKSSSLGQISPTIENGSIEIMDLVYGDLDCDSKAKPTDLILMRRHVAGGYDQTIDELSADVNTDGTIDITDVILLRRYIVGGYGVTFPYTGSNNPGGGAIPDEPVDPNAVKFAATSIHSIDKTTVKVLDENSSVFSEYPLAQDCEFYVNDVLVTFDSMNQYLQDQRSMVTLIDEGDPTADSTYNKIKVDYYKAARVYSVTSTTSSAKIRTDQLGLIAWNPNETTTTVDIIKDDKYISYTDIKEDDIILVRYDPTVSDISDSSHIKIYVSDKTATGVLTGKATTVGNEYILLDGIKYRLDDPSIVACFGLAKEYTLYLDAMDFVYDFDVIKHIGIVAQMYQTVQDDTPTVVLIDANGDVHTYLTKTTMDAANIDTFDGTVDYTIAKLKDNQGTLNQRFVEYRISGGKLVFEDHVTPDAVSGGMFKTSTSTLGSYTIDETATTILDLENYLYNDGEPRVYPYSSLENENTYDALVADRNAKTGVYGFAVLTTGTSSLRATSALAVVTSCGSMTSVDGVPVEALTVARNGEEDIEVLVRDIGAVTEGSIIMYTVGSDGYVENGRLKVIYKPYDSYSAMATAMFADLTAGDLFTKVAYNAFPTYIKPVTATAYGSTVTTGYTLDMSNNGYVELYVAPVYSATSSVLQVFTGQATAGQSSIARETEAFSLAGANVYTYNFDMPTGRGVSVSVGGVTQPSVIFRGCYTDASLDAVDWSAVLTDAINGDIAPSFAFVRVNDGVVTDVVYYVAN